MSDEFEHFMDLGNRGRSDTSGLLAEIDLCFEKMVELDPNNKEYKFIREDYERRKKDGWNFSD